MWFVRNRVGVSSKFILISNMKNANKYKNLFFFLILIKSAIHSGYHANKQAEVFSWKTNFGIPIALKFQVNAY